MVTRLYAVHSDGYLQRVATLDKYAKYEDMAEEAHKHVCMEGDPIAFLYTCESDQGGGIIMPFNLSD